MSKYASLVKRLETLEAKYHVTDTVLVKIQEWPPGYELHRVPRRLLAEQPERFQVTRDPLPEQPVAESLLHQDPHQPVEDPPNVLLQRSPEPYTGPGPGTPGLDPIDADRRREAGLRAQHGPPAAERGLSPEDRLRIDRPELW